VSDYTSLVWPGMHGTKLGFSKYKGQFVLFFFFLLIWELNFLVLCEQNLQKPPALDGKEL
jgi:hypothetical protein